MTLHSNVGPNPDRRTKFLGNRRRAEGLRRATNHFVGAGPGHTHTVNVLYVSISFRWSLCLSAFGRYCIDFKHYNGWLGPFVFFSCTKTSLDFTLHYPTRPNASTKENFVLRNGLSRQSVCPPRVLTEIMSKYTRDYEFYKPKP